MNAKEKIRLFVSVEVPVEIKKKVSALAEELPEDSIRVVKPENMHLTLKFLGETPYEKLAGIEKALQAVRFAHFKCRIKGAGVFPNENYIRVVWAGVECAELVGLAKEVAEALRGFGKKESFSGHLTIARVKKKIEITEFLRKHAEEDFGEFEIKSFNLMQSVLSREGPTYCVVASFSAEEKNA